MVPAVAAHAEGVFLACPACPVISAFFFVLGGAKAAEVMAAPAVNFKMPLSDQVTHGQTLKYL